MGSGLPPILRRPHSISVTFTLRVRLGQGSREEPEQHSPCPPMGMREYRVPSSPPHKRQSLGSLLRGMNDPGEVAARGGAGGA